MAPGSDKVRVLIVDDIPETRENVRKLLAFEADMEVVGVAGTGREAIQLARDLQPNIIMMDINMPDIDGITAVETITREVPIAQVIMMSVQSEADYLRRSMLAGARDFLTKPFSSEDLVSTIRRVHRMTQSRAAAAPAVMPSQAPQPAGRGTPAAAAPSTHAGAIIVVYGPKGGIGTTTLAVNLAVALQHRAETRVLLIDCSLQFGDVGVLLNLPSGRNIADLVETIADLDPDSISTITLAHASGVKAILAPPRPEMADLLQPDHLKRILNEIQTEYDYILLDTATVINDLVLTVLDLADRIVLVTTPDIPAIKNARLFFEITDALNYPPNKIMLVVNKIDRHTGITAQMIEDNIKHQVIAQIPLDETVVLNSINRGVPFMADGRVRPVSQAVQQLADRLVGELASAGNDWVGAKDDQSDDAVRKRLSLFR
jgi:pilus assembly protein CpaE